MYGLGAGYVINKLPPTAPLFITAVLLEPGWFIYNSCDSKHGVDRGEPFPPSGNPSSGLDPHQDNGHRAGFESVVKALNNLFLEHHCFVFMLLELFMLLISLFATFDRSFCCTHIHQDWCWENIYIQLRPFCQCVICWHLGLMKKVKVLSMSE